MPAILAAVEAYATVGEISDALRRAFGEYQESVVISAAAQPLLCFRLRGSRRPHSHDFQHGVSILGAVVMDVPARVDDIAPGRHGDHVIGS